MSLDAPSRPPAGPPDERPAHADAHADAHAEPDAPGDRAASCAYWDFCPNCGAALVNRGCKYRCSRCHYFMSCSDFD